MVGNFAGNSHFAIRHTQHLHGFPATVRVTPAHQTKVQRDALTTQKPLVFQALGAFFRLNTSHGVSGWSAVAHVDKACEKLWGRVPRIQKRYLCVLELRHITRDNRQPVLSSGCRNDEVGLGERVPGFAPIFHEKTPCEHHIF
jgi:hypothetical protein